MKQIATLATIVLLVGAACGGCSKKNESSGSAAQSTTTEAGAAAMLRADREHGKTVFTENCAACHGAGGIEGGIGPSLKGERARKNESQTVAWIKNPTPPMPKLYPGSISEKDVNDVAAYVQSL